MEQAIEGTGEEELLEILDFTNQSPWERFAAALSALLRTWDLTKAATSDPPPVYAGVQCIVTYSGPAPARETGWEWLASRESDSEQLRATRVPPVEQLFGVREYVLVKPMDRVDVSFATLVLSALTCACGEIQLCCPVFVQYGDSEFVGFQLPGSDAGFVTRFSSMTLRSMSEESTSLGGLIPYATSALAAADDGSALVVTTQYNYYQQWQGDNWRDVGPDALFPGEFPRAATVKNGVLWGASEDPIRGMQISVQWEQNGDSEGTLESDAMVPRRWVVKCDFKDSVSCMLAKSVRNMISGMIDTAPFQSVFQIINAKQVDEKPSSVVASFSNSFIPTEHEVTSLLSSLFHQEEIPAAPESDVVHKSGLKAAPAYSLLEGLALKLLNIRGLSGYLVIWREFVRAVRAFVDGGQAIPRTGDSPDFSCCLIHQKLQMLNFCTFYNKASKSKAPTPNPIQKPAPESSKFAYVDETGAEGEDGWGMDATPLPLPEPASKEPSSDTRPGFLILGGEMVIPALQVSGVQTEDMLVSDMMAFKHSNPTAMFEDFIRWYSPTDWIKGKLTPRMASPDNAWKVLWEEARPQDVASQQPLFDKEREAARVFDYLENLRPAELLQQYL
eukprot:m51a1_g13877 hypothetical protein (616) ;mRNA; f:642552-645188